MAKRTVLHTVLCRFESCLVYVMAKGDYGLTEIKGALGFFVGFGLFLSGDASRFTHAFIDIGDGKSVEARPGGAVVRNISEYPASKTVYSHLPLTDEERIHIAHAALKLVGRGYNWLDYPALALLRLGVRPKWLTRYVADKGRLICSQLVDEAYRLGGIHLFNDGRPSQDVTPGDLTYVGNVY
jgi:uncharacterized protein YycO